MNRWILVVLALASCGKREAAPAPSPAPAPASSPAPSPSPAPAPSTGTGTGTGTETDRIPVARPGGPTAETCTRAADHLKQLFVTLDQGSTRAQLQAISSLLDRNRDEVIRYCLEVASPREMDCVLAATRATELAGCERLRQEVPEKLAAATELTEADCVRFFDRLRQFKIADGVAPETIDRDRDQIVRACQEKAKPGTVACFIASPTYEQARRCP